MKPHIDVALLFRLLDIDPDETLFWLLRTTRLRYDTMPPLVLSVIERAGTPLGSGAADELRRARHRSAQYADLVDRLAADDPIRVVKGPALADRYPPGLQRSVGDIDIVVPDEPRLWEVVGRLRAELPINDIGLAAMQSGADRHLWVTLAWPSEDPLLDRPRKVDVSTAAFSGDSDAVGLRATLPDDPWIADLLSLAEERFQREFNPKDIIDVMVMFADPRPGPDMVAAADGYQLAPELVELLRMADERAGVPGAAEVIAALGPAAIRERRRRAAWRAPVVADDLGPVRAQLARGHSVAGLMLREVDAGGPAPAGPVHAEMIHTERADLMLTPMGDFLMVADPVVEQEQYADALAELDALGRRSAAAVAAEGQPGTRT